MGDQQGAGPLRLVYPRPRWRLAPSRCHQPDRIDPRPAADDRLLLLPLTDSKDQPQVIRVRDHPFLGETSFRYDKIRQGAPKSVSYTHLRAHETRHDIVCRLLLEKKK